MRVEIEFPRIPYPIYHLEAGEKDAIAKQIQLISIIHHSPSILILTFNLYI